MSHNRITTDSPLSHRIVRSFLHFLNQVEPSPGVDAEGIEVARECLVEAFKINNSASVTGEPDSLIDIFKSFDANKQCERSRLDSMKASSSVSPQNAAAADAKTRPDESKPMDEDWTQDPHTSAVSKDELCGQFFAVLEKKHYFRTNIDGGDDIVQLEKASRLFDDGFTEMERSGCQQFNLKNLAESLKTLGNKAMQSKQYFDAIELYNCAIAIYEKSAVYYCNRAAAYTQINRYTEAIQDSLRSIEIDPNYSKAYSRLGLAYYAQGNYRDAIDKGFKKALQLDPNNESVKENIRVAEHKLMEERHHADHNQNSRSQEFQNHYARGSRSHAAPASFGSMPFNPSNLASMFMAAANAGQGSHSQEGQEDANGSGANEPEIRFAGNVNVNQDQIPQELRGAFQSVMHMFSGNAPPGQPHDQMNGSHEDANSSEDNEPDIQFGGNVNLNSDQIPQELSGVFQNVMEMLSGNAPPGQPHDQTNERTAPN